MWITLIAVISASICVPTSATTEWFGDLRAQLNPPRAPAFYDVTYDDSECPQGLQSNAIPDYVYFGAMIATMTVTEHTECLEQCIGNSKCNAVNFFEPMSYQEKGFCELLAETQVDNPRLMRPFKKAVYYENIRCRTEDDDSEAVTNPSRPAKEAPQTPTRTPEARKSAEKQTVKSTESQSQQTPLQSQESVTKDKDGSVELPELTEQDAHTMAVIMKQLSEKVHEFNLRFRS